MEVVVKAILTFCILASIASLWRFLEHFWWRPMKLASKLRKQGLRGPPPKFMQGNLPELMSMRQAKNKQPLRTITHEILEHSMPDYTEWSNKYGIRIFIRSLNVFHLFASGNQYVFWWGTEPRVNIVEPELIRDVLARRMTLFGKSEVMIRGVVSFIGRGLLAVQGDEWSFHRRVVAPSFYAEKLKAMTAAISGCAESLIDDWEMVLSKKPELDVVDDFRKVTADIISHTAFGSSYAQGYKVFDTQQEISILQRKVLSYTWIPLFRFMPLPINLRIRKLQSELNSILLGLVSDWKNRVKSGINDSYGNDLLGLLLSESESEKGSILNDQSIADECRTFYFAGHETTATLLTWTVMLLAAYPEWQERLRAEVHADDASKDDAFNKYKLMKMVFNETLRLYPPVMMMMRGVSQDTQLGDLHLPKGSAVSIPIIAIHRSTEFWGPDANEFNPERFKDGVSAACKHPSAFLPFSLGPRVCVGQSFAMLEAKIVLAAILRRFSFKLSPNYIHNPITSVALRPFNGLPIILTKVTGE